MANLNNECNITIIEEELVPYIIQLRARDDPITAQWRPMNEHDVAGGLFFIDEKQPSGKYELLKIPRLNSLFSRRTMKMGMWDITKEDVAAEREERLLFPELNRILALEHPDANKLIEQLAEEA